MTPLSAAGSEMTPETISKVKPISHKKKQSTDIWSFFPHWTFCPAIEELFAGHFQNSPEISGVSGEFREASF